MEKRWRNILEEQVPYNTRLNVKTSFDVIIENVIYDVISKQYEDYYSGEKIVDKILFWDYVD